MTVDQFLGHPCPRFPDAAQRTSAKDRFAAAMQAEEAAAHRMARLRRKRLALRDQLKKQRSQ